ncbi:MAG: TOBE domain-containing protein, partial [Cypionkella sp.]|nr:TOBE domain-containing protein [Cypionkella sp.]
SSKVVVLNAGRVEQIGPPMELYDRPANRFVAAFIGSPQMNFLKATLRESGGAILVDLAGQSLSLPVRAANVGQVTEVGLRPEHIRLLAPGAPGLAARVSTIERLGAETLVFVKTQTEQALVLRAEGGLAVAEGQDVSLAIAPEHLHFFDRNGARVDLAAKD